MGPQIRLFKSTSLVKETEFDQKILLCVLQAKNNINKYFLKLIVCHYHFDETLNYLGPLFLTTAEEQQHEAWCCKGHVQVPSKVYISRIGVFCFWSLSLQIPNLCAFKIEVHVVSGHWQHSPFQVFDSAVGGPSEHQNKTCAWRRSTHILPSLYIYMKVMQKNVLSFEILPSSSFLAR